MLHHFNAALATLGRNQPLDHLASLGETFLAVEAIVFVERGEENVPVGAGLGGRQIDALTLRRALQVPLADVPDAVEACSTPIPHRFLSAGGGERRILHLDVRAPRSDLSCVIFCAAATPSCDALVRFVAAARRTSCEHALLCRYRTDLKRYFALFDHLQRTANIGVWEYDAQTKRLFWSDQVFRIFGLKPAETIPANWRDYIASSDVDKLDAALEQVRQTGISIDISLCVVVEEGKRRVVRMIASRQGEDERNCRVSGIMQDVTELAEATEKLWWTANHDPLTGLPNRALFADRFKKALQRRVRTGKHLAVVLVDVDKFKEVNDTLGHAAGDELLRRVAAVLKHAVRRNDTVARSGGDEFSILMEDFHDTDALDAVLTRLKRSMDVRLEWEASVRHISLSGGAAVAPEHGKTERDLLAAADLALYRMKDVPGPSLALYRPSFGRDIEERNRLLSRVREALRAGRFRPHYQPQVDVAAGRVVGVEVLARWVEEDGTVLPASAFAGALEDGDLGRRIAQQIVDQAIAEIAALNASRSDKIALSIEASSGRVVRENFLARLQRAGGLSGDGAGPVTVEVTEDVILEDATGGLAEFVAGARERGVAFCLDEAGTGDGPLVDVTTRAVSETRIERCFVKGLEADPGKQKVVRGLVDVARSLGMRLVVEGVETSAEAEMIVALGGRFAPGFPCARALGFDALSALLAEPEAIPPVSAPVACVAAPSNDAQAEAA